MNKERLLSKPLWDADVPLSWDQCCQNVELVYYKHGTQRAIVFKHHHNPIKNSRFLRFSGAFHVSRQTLKRMFFIPWCWNLLWDRAKVKMIFSAHWESTQYPIVLCWYNTGGHSSSKILFWFLQTYKPSALSHWESQYCTDSSPSPCQPTNHSPWITEPAMQ